MFDLAIDLHVHDDKCLYEQIYDHIKNEIERGKLLQGERLPSTRALAEYLQIARTTTQQAYEQLETEGYIEARPYKGYFVCKMDVLPEKSYSLKKRSEILTKKVDIKSSIQFDFSPNGLDMSAFPYETWKKITKSVLNDGNSDIFTLGNPQGDESLRETISRYLHSARGVNCSKDQIIVGAGNDYLLLLLEKLLPRKTSVAMENATYLRAYRIFSSFGYKVETISTDESGICVNELKKSDADIVYIMPSHQYPSGVTMPVARRRELLKWAAQQDDRYIIEDDYDSEFRYKGKPIPSLQGVDTNEKVIYIGTFSKAIAPAIRISYLVLPDFLIKKYREECFFFSSTVSRVDQQILDVFMRDGYFERYLNRMRKRYREKHDILLRELKPFQNQFIISGEHAGLHVLLRAKNLQIKEENLIKKAEEKGVKVYGISDAMIHKQESMPATIILGYGALQEKEIIDGIEKIKQAWD